MSRFLNDANGAYIEKGPNDSRFYVLNWTAWLGVSETIQSVFVTTNGLTQPFPASVNSDTISVKTQSGVMTIQPGMATIIWLSGGAPDTEYVVSCRITTTLLQEQEKTFRVKIKPPQ